MAARFRRLAGRWRADPRRERYRLDAIEDMQEFRGAVP